MSKSAIDANIQNQIFRNDFAQVIASGRASAKIHPIRLKVLSSEDYPAGQVLALNTSTGLYEKFSTASGSYDAACVLMTKVSEDEQSATGGALARGIFGGCDLYKDALTDYDSGAASDLNAREITIAGGTDLVVF